VSIESGASVLINLIDRGISGVPMLLAAAVNGEPSSMLLVWGIILFLVAAFFFGLEIFIPTGGVLGILAAVAVAASVAAFFRYEPLWGGISLGIYLILAPFAAYFGIKFWSHSPITRSLILDGDDPSFLQEPDEAMASSEQERRRRLDSMEALVGVEGRTVTALRPVGVVLIDGRRIDALAEFGIIDAGTHIEVVQVLDNQVKVRPALPGRRTRSQTRSETRSPDQSSDQTPGPNPGQPSETAPDHEPSGSGDGDRVPSDP